jgi:hypothetical protein
VGVQGGMTTSFETLKTQTSSFRDKPTIVETQTSQCTCKKPTTATPIKSHIENRNIIITVLEKRTQHD